MRSTIERHLERLEPHNPPLRFRPAFVRSVSHLRITDDRMSLSPDLSTRPIRFIPAPQPRPEGAR